MDFVGITNTTSNSTDISPWDTALQVVDWVTFAMGLPVSSLAIYILCRVVRFDRMGPVYTINLQLSNMLNFVGRQNKLLRNVNPGASSVMSLTFYYSIITNISFKMCIAMEMHRRLVQPRCYARYSSIRHSALVSLLAWAAPFALLALAILGYLFAFSICLLLPFPCLLFYLTDTCRALTCSTSVSREEKRRILGTLGYVVCSYMTLFLPFILKTLFTSLLTSSERHWLDVAANLLLFLCPLMDPLLGLFVRIDASDVRKALPCCYRTARQLQGAGGLPTVSQTVTNM